MVDFRCNESSTSSESNDTTGSDWEAEEEEEELDEGPACSAGENCSKEANNRCRCRQKALAVDPFALDEKERQSLAVQEYPLLFLPFFFTTKTKRIACSGQSEDGKNLI